MGNLFLIVDLLVVLANAYPKIAPKVKDLIEMIKGESAGDITQGEFEKRIDEAIAKLPKWE